MPAWSVTKCKRSVCAVAHIGGTIAWVTSARVQCLGSVMNPIFLMPACWAAAMACATRS